jgi:hypothetical protein
MGLELETSWAIFDLGPKFAQIAQIQPNLVLIPQILWFLAITSPFLHIFMLFHLTWPIIDIVDLAKFSQIWTKFQQIAAHQMWALMCMPDVVELANIRYTSSVALTFAPREVAHSRTGHSQRTF